MDMQRRLMYFTVHIDTNLINARQRLPEVNQLEKWCQDDVLIINMSATAWHEAQAGNDELRARKAAQQVFTITEPVDHGSEEFRKAAAILFPDGVANENQRNDVCIVCEAAKYGAILVTNDGGSKSQPGGILGNRSKFGDAPRIKSPSEMVAFVRREISARDEFNREVHRRTGQELPDWTGKD